MASVKNSKGSGTGHSTIQTFDEGNFTIGLFEIVRSRQKNRMRPIVFFFIEIVQTLQLLSLPFLSGFEWPRDNGYVSLFVDIVKLIRLDALLVDDNTCSAKLPLFAVWGIVGLFVILSIFLMRSVGSYRLKNGNFGKYPAFYQFCMSLYSEVYDLLSSLLFLPVLGILLAFPRFYIQKRLIFTSNIPACSPAFDASLFDTIISLVLLLSFVVFMNMMKLVDFRSGAVQAKSNRLELLYTFAKSVIYIVFHLLPSDSVDPSMMGASLIAVWFLITTLFGSFLPFTNISSNKIRLACLCTLVWSGITLVLTGMSEGPSNENSGVTLFFGGLLLALYLGYIMSLARIDRLKKIPMVSINNSYVFELKLQITEFDMKSNTKAESKDFQYILRQQKIQNIKDFIRRNPESLFIRLMLIETYQLDERYFHQLLSEVIYVENQKMRLDIKYIVYATKVAIFSNIKQKWHSDSVLKEIMSQERFDKVLNDDIELMEIYDEYWVELISKYPRPLKLANLARIIRGKIQEVSLEYEEIIKMKQDKSEVMERYADFLNIAMTHSDLASSYIEQAHICARKETDEDQLAAAEIMQIRNEDCTLTVTSNDKLNSIITEANATAQKLFGMPQNDLLGNSISSIIPPPIGQPHTYITNASSKSGQGMANSEAHSSGSISFVTHRSGGIIPVFMFVKNIPKYTEENTSIVVLRDVRKYSDKFKLMALLDVSSNSIQSATTDFCTYMGYEIHDVIGKFIEDFIPEFNENLSKMKEEEGFYITSGNNHFQAFLEEKSIDSNRISTSYYILRLESRKVYDNMNFSFTDDRQNKNRTEVAFLTPRTEAKQFFLEGRIKPEKTDLRLSAFLLTEEELEQDKAPENNNDVKEKTEVKDENQSVASSAVTNHMESVYMNSIRLSLRNGGEFLPIVKSFSRSTIQIIGIIWLTAAVMILAIPVLFEGYKTKANMNDVGLRRFLSCAMAYEAENLALINAKYINDTDGSIQARARDNLKKYSQRLENIEIELESIPKIDELKALYRNPDITVAVSNLGKETKEKTNLRDAENRLIASAKDVAKSDIETISAGPSHPAAFFIIQNGPFSIVQGLNESVFLFQEGTAREVQMIEHISIGLTISSIAVVVLLNVFILFPTIRSVHKRRDAIHSVMTSIPMGSRRVIRAVIQERLDRLRLITGKDEAKNEEGEDSNRIDENESLKLKVARMERKSNIAVFLKLSILTIIATAFFLTVHFSAFLLQKERITEGPKKVNWAGYRRASIMRQNILIRSVLNHEDFFDRTLEDIYNEALTEIDLSENINNDLIYGAYNSRGLLPEFNEKDEVHKALLFRDACTAYTPEGRAACGAFSNHVLSGGLQAALVKFYALERSILDNFNDVSNDKIRRKRNITGLLTSPEWTEITDFALNFLPVPIGKSVRLYNEELISTINQTTVMQTILFFAFLLLTVIFYLVVFAPLRKQLQDELMNSATMLIMVPEDVRRGNAALQIYITKTLKGNKIK